jgi:hypothetical protein
MFKLLNPLFEPRAANPRNYMSREPWIFGEGQPARDISSLPISDLWTPLPFDPLSVN